QEPGRLCPPAAAILCLLLWRAGMLGTRVLALVLFARLYCFWVFAVAGKTCDHLPQTILLSAKEMLLVLECFAASARNGFALAVIESQNRFGWKGPLRSSGPTINPALPSPPLDHVAARSGLSSTPHRNTAGTHPLTPFCSFLGAAALVVYYGLLHPKSTEIWQGFLERSCSGAAAGDDEVAGDGSQTGQSLGILGHSGSLAGEGTTADPKPRNSSPLLQFGGRLEDGWTTHHHWLLVKLALKTGDMSMVNAAFGDGGVGEVYPGGWVMGKPGGVEPGPSFSHPTREVGPWGVQSDLTDEKLQAVGIGGGSKSSAGAARTAREDGAGQEPGFPSAVSFPSSFSPDLAEVSSVYFSASAGGITSSGTGTATATCVALVQRDGKALPPPGCLGQGEGGGDLSLGMASISPILGACAHQHLQSSSSLGGVSGCGVAGPPEEGSEPAGLEGALMGWHRLWDTHPDDKQETVVRSKLRPPCFTSTPKADLRCPQRGPQRAGRGDRPVW
ncbi:XKR5 protein, partial [Nyctibius bracteatus]|nr:XKR5 protein [Nyctibius bracteatus]